MNERVIKFSEKFKIFYIKILRLPSEKAHTSQIFRMCNAFIKLGLDIKLFIPKRREIKTKNYWEKKTELDLKKFYGTEFEPEIIKVKIIDLLANPKYHSINFILQTFIQMILTFFYIMRYRKQNPPQILYFRDDWMLCTFFALTKIIHNTKMLYELHSPPSKFMFFLKRIWNKIDGIITISDRLKRQLITSGIKEQKIISLPHGVMLDRYESMQLNKNSFKKKWDIPLDKTIILYTGQLYTWKGLETLISAMQFIDKVHVYLLIIGGNLKDINRLKSYAEKLKIDNLKFIKFIPPSEVIKFQKVADIAVLTSSNIAKGRQIAEAPLKLFEYMAAKLAIVAPEDSHLKNVLKNKENCLIYRRENPEELALCIKKIIEDKKLREKIVNTSFLSVKSYSYKKRAQKINEFVTLINMDKK